MKNTNQLGLIIAMITLAVATVGLVTVGIVNAAPAFVMSGTALFAAGAGSIAAASRQTSRQAPRR